MDLKAVQDEAQLLLNTLIRFQGPVDRGHLTDTAHNGDGTWRNQNDQLRLVSRATELLFRSGDIRNGPDLTSIELTDRGRNAAAHGLGSALDEDWVTGWVESENLREALDVRQRISANTFSELELFSWRQFTHVDISFHPRLTILTGANASGKTTILNVLAPHLNWQAQLVMNEPTSDLQRSNQRVGTLAYSNGANTDIVEQPGSGVRNAPLSLTFTQTVPGLFISSHRSISAYQPLANLPPRFSESESLLSQFAGEIQARYQGAATGFSPLYRMKESLFAAAMYAYGNEAVEADDAAKDVWEGFQLILKDLLPNSLGFVKLFIRNGEVILLTVRTAFPIEAVSGGISAMIELAWQIFLRSRNQESFTVCIDEPENHLHPELQRRIMPSLLKAFPDVSFIVATHSPFVVTSSRDAYVFALSQHDGDDGVRSRRIETTNFSATADETLMSVLGLDTSLPVWAEDEIQRLLTAVGNNPSATELRRLRDGLNHVGLGRQFPAAVESIGGERRDSDQAE